MREKHLVTVSPELGRMQDQTRTLTDLVEENTGRTPPSKYVVARSNGSIEKFQANSDEEALERLQQEVRAGQTKIVYCYKLWCAEEFVPSSRNLTIEQIAPKSPK